MADTITLVPTAALRGELTVPGDKSISHRALVLAAAAEGMSAIGGRAEGADQDSMVACLRALGVGFDGTVAATEVRGVGLRGFATPSADLDCGNSGATMRFLTGLLSGVPGMTAQLTGDASLSRRPMTRVAEPLRGMGAEVETSVDGRPPLRVSGRPLRGVDLAVEVASAQVKTAILLAALNAAGRTALTAPVSRDHTERLLRVLGVDLEVDDKGTITLTPPDRLPPLDLAVAGDPSSAAVWAVLGTIHPDADVLIRGVCLNPGRTGFLEVLRRMGADIETTNVRQVGGEDVGDIHVRSAALRATEVGAAEVPTLVDEVPVLAVAASMADGETWFRGLGELRYKEVDRVEAVARQLGRMGAEIEVEGDDMLVRGRGRLQGAEVDSLGDHRMAMSLAVAASVAAGETRISGADVVAISYPGFFSELEKIST